MLILSSSSYADNRVESFYILGNLQILRSGRFNLNTFLRLIFPFKEIN